MLGVEIGAETGSLIFLWQTNIRQASRFIRSNQDCNANVSQFYSEAYHSKMQGSGTWYQGNDALFWNTGLESARHHKVRQGNFCGNNNPALLLPKTNGPIRHHVKESNHCVLFASY